jgi:hypothetical protein
MIKIHGPLDQVDLYAGYALGSKTMDNSGNEFIYLSGVASCAQYDWVTFTGNSTGSVTRLATASAKGNVAIAQAAITNNRYGWFLIKGQGRGNADSGTTAGDNLYSSGTVAIVKSLTTPGSIICRSVAKSSVAGGSIIATIEYPFITSTQQ